RTEHHARRRTCGEPKRPWREHQTPARRSNSRRNGNHPTRGRRLTAAATQGNPLASERGGCQYVVGMEQSRQLPPGNLIATLRSAGCVDAEEEAAILQ